MRLYSDVQREFPSDLMVMVEALAHQGGLAIQNASMYLKLQEDKKSLEEDIWEPSLLVLVAGHGFQKVRVNLKPEPLKA